MQNEATFHTIGRIARITNRDKVSYINVAVNKPYQKDGEWKETTEYVTVTFFKKSQDWAKNARTGDLVRIAGDVVTNSFERDGDTVYNTDLVARRHAILARSSNGDSES
ncbi:MAG: single-stranded DNA-binding protein [Parasphingopyxis sp.]